MILYFIFFFVHGKSHFTEFYDEPIGDPILTAKNDWSYAGNYLEYKFKGVRFQINHKNADIEYKVLLDGQLQTIINNQMSDNLYISKLFPYDEHTIQLEGLFSNNDEISYWLSMRAKRIPISQFDNIDQWNFDVSGEDRYFTQNDGNYVKHSFQCSKFWVYGVKSNYGGEMKVTFGNYNEVVSTYTQHESNPANYIFKESLIYESPYFPLSFVDLNLIFMSSMSSMSFKILSLYLQYVFILDDAVPNAADFPISVAANSLTMSNAACEPETQYGVICKTSKSYLPTTFEYTFKGVRFQIYGSYSPDLEPYSIYLDDIEVAIVNQEAEFRKDYVLQYTSDILLYSEHTIKLVKSAGDTIRISKITYWPSLHAKRMNISDFTATTINPDDNINDLLKTETDFCGGRRYYTTGPVVLKKVISCSKFWIIGSYGTSYSTNTVTFGSISQNFSLESQRGRKDCAILFESNRSKYSTSELIINVSGFSLFNYIYYVDEPDSAEPVSVSVSDCSISGSFNSGYIMCPENQISTSPCGYNYYSIKGTKTSFSYIFKGVRFQVYGTCDKYLTSFSIYLDGELHAKVNEKVKNDDDRRHHTLLFTSNLLPYGYHSIVITNDENEVFEITKITYWVSMEARRVNSTQFTMSESDWIIKSDETGGLTVLSKFDNAQLMAPIRCTKFWIIGNGYVSVAQVSFGNYNKYFTIPSTTSSVVYESDEFESSYNDLIITTPKNTKINCVYIMGEYKLHSTEAFSKSEDFSNSHHLTQTTSFTESAKFSSSIQFSETNEFSKTDDFSETSKFSKTIVFSKSQQFTINNYFSNINDFTKSYDLSKSYYITEETSLLFITKNQMFSNENGLSFSKSIDENFPNSFFSLNSNSNSNLKSQTITEQTNLQNIGSFTISL